MESGSPVVGNSGITDYVRLNFACPPRLLEEGLQRLKRGVEAARDQA